MTTDAQRHWQRVYEVKAVDEVSWYEPVSRGSLALIAKTGLALGDPIVDVGGGASGLVGGLLDAGYRDITVADISAAALERSKVELGPAAAGVAWVEADVREHNFSRRFALWHDRATFHFMVEPDDRDAYLANLRSSLRPGGHLVIAVFGPEGPTACSGLPVARYSAAALTDLLPDFELLSSRLQLHHTPSATAQQFLQVHLRRRG